MPQTYSSYTSTSFTTSSTSNGQTTGQAYKESSQTTPEGTTTQTTTQRLGEPAQTEVRSYDAQGSELLRGGPTGGAGLVEASRVTDVTDDSVESEADKLYRERMEDEYAKREGGA